MGKTLMNGDPRVTHEEQGMEGIVHDTNPLHYVDETYDDYEQRIASQTTKEPASEAEWANAEQIDPNAPAVEEVSAEDEEADLEEHLQELEEEEEDEEENDDDDG